MDDYNKEKDIKDQIDEIINNDIYLLIDLVSYYEKIYNLILRCNVKVEEVKNIKIYENVIFDDIFSVLEDNLYFMRNYNLGCYIDDNYSENTLKQFDIWLKSVVIVLKNVDDNIQKIIKDKEDLQIVDTEDNLTKIVNYLNNLYQQEEKEKENVEES